MALFKGYEKVARWDKLEEIEGINEGTVHVQEKIDGANGQVFFHDGHILVGKRSCVIGRCKKGGEPEIEDGFRGFPNHIFRNECYQKFFQAKALKNMRLYGEWLVKHTVNYDPKFMNIFYVFDVYDDKMGTFLDYKTYLPWLEDHGIPYVPLKFTLENALLDHLLDFVRIDSRIPKSDFGAEVIEGLVFKNYDFVNRWGNNVYMKATTKDFREIHHAVMGATKRDDIELQLIAKYLQPARMEKLYQKLIDIADHELSMKDVPRFMGMVLHDLVTEDAWDMLYRDKIIKRSKGVLNVNALKHHSDAKAKNWYVAKLQGRITQ